jgi:hypothetical protein
VIANQVKKRDDPKKFSQLSSSGPQENGIDRIGA